MSGFDFDTPVDRRDTDSEKWDRYRGQDVIPMWVADMDFRAPQPVIDALHRRIEHGVFGYGNTPRQLIEQVVAHLARDFDWQVQPSWIVWLPGLVTGLNVACRAVGGEGTRVSTMVPVYPPFLSAPRYQNRQLSTSNLLLNQGRWELDYAALEEQLADAELLLLCNPHNPVGRVYSKPELARLAQLCERHDVIICADEIHCGLILDEMRHVPIATLAPEIARRTITLMAPSKTFNIPGLYCSFAVISEVALRQRFLQAMQRIVPHVNVLGYTAALAAYRDGWDWQRALVQYLRANRDHVERWVDSAPGLRMAHVEATYLAWIDARGLGVDDPARFFERAGVGLSDGEAFGAPGFVRLNFGCPRATLEAALQRMAGALRSK